MNSRSVIPHVLLTGSAATAVSLGWYLWVLLGRTEFLARGTSLSPPVIVGFHVLGVSAVAVSALAQRHLKARHGWAIFAAACVVEMTFFLLNLFGKVWYYQKEEPESLYAAVVHLILGSPTESSGCRPSGPRCGPR